MGRAAFPAQVCSHPAANCELFLPFDRAILVHLTTRLEFGRHDANVEWRVPFVGKASCLPPLPPPRLPFMVIPRC